jgi:hypothetical protein
MPASHPDRPVSADDLAVTLAVRQDLGPEHDEAVIAEFLDRVGPAIDARAAAVASSQQDARPGATVGDTGLRSTILAGASIVAGIPITAIALNSTESAAGGLLATLVAWTGIAVVNIAHGRRG